MKILHVVNVRWFNATAWFAFNLAYQTKIDNNEVVIACCYDDPISDKAFNAEIDVFYSHFNTKNPSLLSKSVSETYDFLKRFSPDVVVCHRGEFFLFFALYRYFMKPNWKLVRVRGDARNPKNNFINRFLYSKCSDAFVTTSSSMRDYAIEKMGVNADKVKVLFGGVDNTKFFKSDTIRANMRRSIFGEREANYKVVGIVARFDEVKGYEYLLRAFKIASDKQRMSGKEKQLRLLIVGYNAKYSKGDMIDKALSYGLTIDEFVIFDELVAGGTINDYINCFDVGVISSVGSETICRVALELSMVGVPVISARTGVLPELVPASCVYDKYDTDRLAELILQDEYEQAKTFTIKEFTDDFNNFVSQI